MGSILGLGNISISTGHCFVRYLVFCAYFCAVARLFSVYRVHLVDVCVADRQHRQSSVVVGNFMCMRARPGHGGATSKDNHPVAELQHSWRRPHGLGMKSRRAPLDDIVLDSSRRSTDIKAQHKLQYHHFVWYSWYGTNKPSCLRAELFAVGILRP